MRILHFLVIGLLLTSCSQRHLPGQRPTAACMAYQRMMTAPLPPYQHEQLRVQCEQSLNALSSSH